MSKVNHQIFIRVYGVVICIKTNKKAFFNKLKAEINKIIPVKFEIISPQITDHNIYFEAIGNKFFGLYENEKYLGNLYTSEAFVTLDSMLRLTVAEFAVSKVFLHAGVVSWKGRAIVIPARSFKGKTSLVAELIKKGALYYSDEYAVLNKNGWVEPFPKQLSLRGIIDEYTQLDQTVESLGGRAGEKNIPVGMILITEFDSKFTAQKWKPRFLSAGQGMMEVIPHTISFLHNTKLALNVLNKVVSRATIVKSKRGEAKEFGNLLLSFFEESVKTD